MVLHWRHNKKTVSQDAQKGRPARPQRVKGRGVNDVGGLFQHSATLLRLLFLLLLLQQSSQVGALEFEAVCGFALVATRFLDRSLDNVAAMGFYRLMVGKGKIGEKFTRFGAAHGIQRQHIRFDGIRLV